MKKTHLLLIFLLIATLLLSGCDHFSVRSLFDKEEETLANYTLLLYGSAAMIPVQQQASTLVETMLYEEEMTDYSLQKKIRLELELTEFNSTLQEYAEQISKLPRHDAVDKKILLEVLESIGSSNEKLLKLLTEIDQNTIKTKRGEIYEQNDAAHNSLTFTILTYENFAQDFLLYETMNTTNLDILQLERFSHMLYEYSGAANMEQNLLYLLERYPGQITSFEKAEDAIQYGEKIASELDTWQTKLDQLKELPKEIDSTSYLGIDSEPFTTWLENTQAFLDEFRQLNHAIITPNTKLPHTIWDCEFLNMDSILKEYKLLLRKCELRFLVK